MMDILDTHQGLPHSVRRENIYDDCIKLYSNEHIFKDFSFSYIVCW